MIAINKLKAKFVERGLTQAAVAKAIGLSERTMVSRIKSGVFGSDEIDKMIEVLCIENPSEIFFVKQ